MSPAVSKTEQYRSLKWFYLLAGANTAFAQCTFGGGMFPLYLKELGLSPERIGVVVGTIPFMQVLGLVATPLVERLGYRRSYLFFYGSRKFTIMALIAAPWVLSSFGTGGVVVFVTACVLLFGVQRALGETAFYPWLKDVVPEEVRGRATGTANFFGTLAAGVGLALAGLLIGHGDRMGLGHFGGFQVGYGLFACIGLVGIAASMQMAGGGKVRHDTSHPPFARRLVASFRDRKFLAFLVGAGVLQGSLGVFAAFMSLYCRQELGLASGRIVHLNIATMGGSVLAGYFGGWAADRWGSRPVLTALMVVLAIMPPGWMLLPTVPDRWRVAAVALAYGVFGAAFFAAIVASVRLMYNTIVPDHKKGEYLAIRYAAVGLIAGTMPTLAGKSVGVFADLGGTWHGLPITPFTPLFGALVVTWLATAVLFSRIHD